MKNLKLNIEMLPMGAWNNDFSKTLPKNEWDILRSACYKRANGRCEICGYQTNDLDAHEIWNFDVKHKTQTLINIVGICSKCHGVKHIRNSQRLGYGENAKRHFLNVNNCSELDYASHLTKVLMDFEEQNKIYRWKILADLTKFGLKNATIKEPDIPIIKNPYENVDWNSTTYKEKKSLFKSFVSNFAPFWISPPKVNSILVNNFQGEIQLTCDNVNKIEWYLDNVKIKTKYNVVGKFKTVIKVENLEGKNLSFILFGDGGQTTSKIFELLPQEAL